MILSKKQGGFLMTLEPSWVGQVSLWPLDLPPTMSCGNQKRLYCNLGPHQSSSLLRENMSLQYTRWGGWAVTRVLVCDWVLNKGPRKPQREEQGKGSKNEVYGVAWALYLF